ncbi:MAG: Small-conductance mechanosensitive ion channel-like protein [Parcubacteria group bacterium GW2011_GWB1_35_5]|nr:MAG: Small-conductance mechanosensitive ion channel-like protein [Parcubacteria group bacterium GW2011_GWC1_34_10]KKP80862.1 MAG: Small-conductance mechanosensitive ion channel-like protein [Parcubacteria group bacterium GW2011_GWB1_35_5]
MTINTWSEVLSLSFKNLWLGVVGFVPNLVVAIVIVLLGWGIGALLGRIVSQVMKAIKVDEALRRAGVEDFLNKGGISLNSGSFLGALVRWFVILVFLVGALEVLQLSQVTVFLKDILNYLPQVIVAVLILIAAGLVADAMKKVVLSSAMTAEITSAKFLATITKWVIWVFAILVTLSQLGIASGFVQTIFTGLVVALSLGLGLAFGLGGQEAAGRVIERVGKEISDKK